MTWHPYTEPPQTVGRYHYRNPTSPKLIYVAQWDGRHFRYTNGGLRAGQAISPFQGDQWREIKEQA